MGKARGLDSSERGFWSRAPGRGGAPESPPSGSLFGRETFSLPPPYCAKLAPPEPAAVVAPGASTGQKPLSPRLQVGRALGTPLPEDGFLFVKLQGNRGWPF